MKPISKAEQLKYIKQVGKDKKRLANECHELWRKILFLRASGLCEYYGCTREATQPHHVKSKGHCVHLKYDPDNGMALCYPHHKGSNEAAHSDINFKDKILGIYPGFKPIRTQQWLELLDLKASKSYKMDLLMEKLYLEEYYQNILNNLDKI